MIEIIFKDNKIKLICPIYELNNAIEIIKDKIEK